ncbi:hypothetical protein [Variovorax sp. OK212]|uniref:hypothetical protein n=1 Tax=Variovorax sp. OK212 TaxID=1882775 RepID=UPI0011607E2E|nr:hypothetical protein [Variovorax sp. OK212]
MKKIELPSVFELDFYRQQQPEFAYLAYEDALENYRANGISMGHLSSHGALRGHLLDYAKKEGSILEIGPFHAPSITGDNVRYMDVLSTEELLEAVKTAGHEISNVPEIHYVAPKGGFDMVDRKFAAVFSGHCIEHQPDLIRHFQGVSSVLEDGGRYYIACPDRRYCFDHYLPETAVVDILAAYHAQRKVHSARTFLAQRLHRSHNDAGRHWAGDHGAPSCQDYRELRKELFIDLPGENDYHDAHAWQFTPTSFFEIINFLHEAGLIEFSVERVYHTRFATQEFTAVLRKGAIDLDRNEVFLDQIPVKSVVAAVKIENKGLQTEIDLLKKQVEELRFQKNSGEKLVEHLNGELASIRASRSWAVTRPLRKLTAQFGMGRRK